MKSPIHPEVEMKQITRHGIVIDYCPQSGGVWLDKGELEKLIEFAKQEIQIQSDNIPFANEKYHQPQVSHSHHQHHKKKRFENPLEEILDFF